MFGINQTTFALAEAGVQGKVDNPGGSEFRRKGHGARAKTRGESSSRPLGHTKPQSRCEPKLASDGQPPGKGRRPSLANREGMKVRREPTEHPTRKTRWGGEPIWLIGHRL